MWKAVWLLILAAATYFAPEALNRRDLDKAADETKRLFQEAQKKHEQSKDREPKH